MDLNCKEVTRRLASGELETANWRGRLVVGFHLFPCSKCRLYKSQLEAMGKAAKALWPKTEERRRRLEEKILKKSDK